MQQGKPADLNLEEAPKPLHQKAIKCAIARTIRDAGSSCSGSMGEWSAVQSVQDAASAQRDRGAAAWRPVLSVVQDSDRQDSSTAPGKGGDNREPHQIVVPVSPRRSESERVNRATLNGHLDSHELVVHATCNGIIGQCKLLAQGFLISATAVRELLGLRVTTLCVLTNTRGSQRSCRHERVGACALRVVVCVRGLHRVVTLAHVAAPDQQR